MELSQPTFIEVDITQRMLNGARRRADNLGRIPNSFMGGQGNLAGFLGESIFRVAFPGAQLANARHYDIRFDNQKWEVKTKRCKGLPKAHYHCSVSAYNKWQRADYYVFVRVLDDYTGGWLVGYMDTVRFRSTATLYRKGGHDPSNNFTLRSDCLSHPISKLWCLHCYKQRSK